MLSLQTWMGNDPSPVQVKDGTFITREGKADSV